MTPHDADGHSHDHAHNHDPSSPEIRVEALEKLLIERGHLQEGQVDQVAERFEHDVGPLNGARVVARAWTDDDFRARLLEDGTTTVQELGVEGLQMDRLVVKENTAEVHNVVVCTLCSCYPWAMLGLPPAWYKSPEYRSRVVREPRKVLSEMGLDVEPQREVRVWDSSAEVRYLVLPQRPAGTEEMTEEELVALVQREAMIGVADVEPPQ